MSQVGHVKPGVRERVATVCYLLGLACFAFTFVLLATVWMIAYSQGQVPENWGEYHGNHGPWRHDPVLMPLVRGTWMMPLPAFCFALVSVIVKFNWRAASLVLASPIVSYLLLATHFWLGD